MEERRLRRFLRERIPIETGPIREGLNEPIPGHMKRWWFALGGTPLYLFLVQVVTGILLTLHYVPSPERAYESVRFLTEEVSFGWWLRSLHRWSSHLMIASVILHVLRVFFTGTYRKPREFTWVFGASLLLVSLGFGFTGYSLIQEQLSYWGLTVATNLLEATPLVGGEIAGIFRGGETVSANTLTRVFVLHIGVLPTILVLLLVAHIFLVRAHGVTRLDEGSAQDRRTFPFFPDHVLTECLVFLAITVLLNVLACVFPAGLGEAADPLNPPEHIKPEWYFYFTFRWLKLAGLHTAVVTLGAGALLFVLWPFVDAGILRGGPWKGFSPLLGALGALGILALTVWEALV